MQIVYQRRLFWVCWIYNVFAMEQDPRMEPRVIRDAEDTRILAEVQLEFNQDLGKESKMHKLLTPINWLRKKNIERKMREFEEKSKND